MGDVSDFFDPLVNGAWFCHGPHRLLVGIDLLSLVDRVENTQIGITMSRFVRQLLFASLIACHAAVTLCGPCLHELSGSSHSMGVASKGHLPGGSSSSGRDTTDGCLICHFFAQGQLPVIFSSEPLIEQVDELVISFHFGPRPLSNPLPSCPRAPPRFPFEMS